MRLPAAKISGLSSGEFVGMVADDPEIKIDLKTFHNAIQNDHEAIRKEEAAYQPIPTVRNVDKAEVLMTYHQIKDYIQSILANVMAYKKCTGN